MRQTFICPLTPSSIAQGERCAPAAFLRSVSNLSGPLSRIEPLSSVPVVTIACPLRCHLVDRSEAHSKSHPESLSPKLRTTVWYGGLNVHLFIAIFAPNHTSPSLPVARLARWYVLVLASELPGLSLLPQHQPCDRHQGMLAIVYNWFAEPFADSERIASSYSGHAWLSL